MSRGKQLEEDTKAFLRVCDVVNKHYPKEYLTLVESDYNENTFRKKIRALYNSVQGLSSSTVGGAGARRSLINSGERADGLRRQGS